MYRHITYPFVCCWLSWLQATETDSDNWSRRNYLGMIRRRLFKRTGLRMSKNHWNYGGQVVRSPPPLCKGHHWHLHDVSSPQERESQESILDWQGWVMWPTPAVLHLFGGCDLLTSNAGSGHPSPPMWGGNDGYKRWRITQKSNQAVMRASIGCWAAGKGPYTLYFSKHSKKVRIKLLFLIMVIIFHAFLKIPILK